MTLLIFAFAMTYLIFWIFIDYSLMKDHDLLIVFENETHVNTFL